MGRAFLGPFSSALHFCSRRNNFFFFKPFDRLVSPFFFLLTKIELVCRLVRHLQCRYVARQEKKSKAKLDYWNYSFIAHITI